MTINLKLRKRLSWVMASIVFPLVMLGYARLSFAQQSTPKMFASAGDASNALFQAAQSDDEQALQAILGAGKEITSSRDDIEDKLERDGFVQKYQEMHRLVKEEGKVRYIGVSNFNAQQMERAMRIAPITSLQPPYSLLARQAEGEILPFAARNGIGVIVYSPMYSGLLSGKMTRERIANLPADDWRGRNRNFQEPLLSHNLRLVELLHEIGQRHNVTAGEVAIAWTLQNPAVTGAIVGVRSHEQVTGIINAGEFRLSAAEVEEIAQAQIEEAQELSLFS
jgi:diketogulonate reductase-like aldo/keto reductase